MDKKLKLFLMNSESYEVSKKEFLLKVSKGKKKICYVLLNKSFENIKEEFKKSNISIEKFCFIDSLSRHYSQPSIEEYCIYLTSPNISEIIKSTSMIVEKKQPDMIIMDEFSSLLNYYPSFDIVKFTSLLKSEKLYKDSEKVFFMLNEPGLLVEESKKLIKDLRLFADETISQ